MVNVAMLSKWHVHARDYARQVNAHPNMQIVVVWDEDAQRGREWAQELNVPFEASLERVLSDPGVDAVVVDTPTNMHKQVLIAAARAKKHIFTEKVLAFTKADAQEIADEVIKAGIKFVISFPHRIMPHNLFAKQVVDAGWLGTITHARVRNAHDGASRDWLPPHFYDEEACGGGAMMDLGAHPMYLLRWLLGQPVRVTSLFTKVTAHPVEDNAVSLIEFANGTIGVSETGFVSASSPYSLELCGTKGTLFVGGALSGKVRLHVEGTDPALNGWVEPDRLPAALPSAMEQWANAIEESAAVEFGIDDAVALSELMEAAYRSYREGKAITI